MKTLLALGLLRPLEFLLDYLALGLSFIGSGLRRAHRWIERTTGIYFGFFTPNGRTRSGYRWNRMLLTIALPYDGYAFSVSVLRWGWYATHLSREERFG